MQVKLGLPVKEGNKKVFIRRIMNQKLSLILSPFEEFGPF